ncbi:MAG: YfcE family phosphodiesterase [Anaerolineae bacterium]|nr:YfcE family phosphodiesterase [Anaerolineae bacterium]
MRIGILSDVHGDYGALETTLNKMKNEHQVSRILCAGDLVGRGPEQNRVVESIRQHNIITVRGNHDEWFYGISTENTDYLKNLPVDWEGKIGSIKVFMCHGKPANNMWGMYRDHLSETYLKLVLKSLKVDVLVTGHTHLPLFMRVDAGVLVNPGSLYAFKSTRETSSSYGILDLSTLEFGVYAAETDTVLLAEVEYEY